MERIKEINKRHKIKHEIAKEKRRHNKKDIVIILAYSVKRIKEKYIEEYSVIKPATNSDSASGKSKGTLLDSPNKHNKEVTSKTGLLK